MVEKKPAFGKEPVPVILEDFKRKFDTETYKLGLELIEAFRTGTCPDRDKTLEAIIEIFKYGE